MEPQLRDVWDCIEYAAATSTGNGQTIHITDPNFRSNLNGD